MSKEDLNSMVSGSGVGTISGFESFEKKPVIGIGSGGIGSGGVSSNVQLISRMTNQMRSLKSEIVQIREELSKNQREKKEAGNEILRLLKDNERVKELENDKNELRGKISELEKQYIASLEILGEKSERVEELKADVMDLKEMLRDQVQQIVHLQKNKK